MKFGPVVKEEMPFKGKVYRRTDRRTTEDGRRTITKKAHIEPSA